VAAVVPPSGVALIIGVDRLLDMSRTAVNAGGDLVACLLLERAVPGSRSGRDAGNAA
jgi:Na+/H+-dicarboxylate symporter